MNFLGKFHLVPVKKIGQLSVKRGKMVKIGHLANFEASGAPKMTLSAGKRPDITSANLSLDSNG